MFQNDEKESEPQLGTQNTPRSVPGVSNKVATQFYPDLLSSRGFKPGLIRQSYRSQTELLTTDIFVLLR